MDQTELEKLNIDLDDKNKRLFKKLKTTQRVNLRMKNKIAELTQKIQEYEKLKIGNDWVDLT